MMYELVFGKQIDDPIPGRILIPEALVQTTIDSIKDGEHEWGFYQLYKVTQQNINDHTQGTLIEEWVKPAKEEGSKT